LASFFFSLFYYFHATDTAIEPKNCLSKSPASTNERKYITKEYNGIWWVYRLLIFVSILIVEFLRNLGASGGRGGFGGRGGGDRGGRGGRGGGRGGGFGGRGGGDRGCAYFSISSVAWKPILRFLPV
jgi:hypothetical protein